MISALAHHEYEIEPRANLAPASQIKLKDKLVPPSGWRAQRATPAPGVSTHFIIPYDNCDIDMMREGVNKSVFTSSAFLRDGFNHGNASTRSSNNL